MSQFKNKKLIKKHLNLPLNRSSTSQSTINTSTPFLQNSLKQKSPQFKVRVPTKRIICLPRNSRKSKWRPMSSSLLTVITMMNQFNMLLKTTTKRKRSMKVNLVLSTMNIIPKIIIKTTMRMEKNTTSKTRTT
mmetsp:Transcript_30392/g.46544  ORF Transcript_30392/g.46544 Transcript_30392/m.46544 type:complete len:133 (-) Transcript_30392:864-1262(-)